MSRSGTVDSVSSSGSSYTTRDSRESTPASSVGSYTDENAAYLASRGYSASPGGVHVVRDIVHVRVHGEKQLLPYEIERDEAANGCDDKSNTNNPSKMAKVMSGNIFMRFLNGSSQPRP